jgi:CDP-diacylglycerol--serine O-phosphatidyltransferase
MLIQKDNPMLRGIYLLPSLFTAGNLALGILSVIYSIHNHYTAASWAIFAAMTMDILDGRVARWTKTTSMFGIEFDSLADLVSFGLAPALLMYQSVLHNMGRPGIAITMFFIIAGAIRLARFNTKANQGEGASEFVGLPIPAAAGILASFSLSYQLFVDASEVTAKTIPLIMTRMPFFFKALPIGMILISLLMVSTVPYVGFKKFKFNRPKSLQLLVFMIISILLIVTYPQNTIFLIFLVYLLSGLGGYLWRYFHMRRTVAVTMRQKRKGPDGSDDNDDQRNA